MAIFREPARGMTLIELTLALVIMGITLCMSLPSLTQGRQALNAHLLADELAVFLATAQRLADERHQDLLIEKHTIDALAHPWQLRVSASETRRAPALLVFEGKRFTHMAIALRYPQQHITVDGFHHKITSGHIKILDTSGTERLRVITSYRTGRVRICAQEASSDYPAC